MGGMALYIMTAVLGAVALGGAAFAFVGMGSEKTQKRVAAVVKTQGSARVSRGPDLSQQRRKTMQAVLKEMEQKQALNKKRNSFDAPPPHRNGGLVNYAAHLLAHLGWVRRCRGRRFVFLGHQAWYVVLLGLFAAGLGLPRWTLGFLKNRREKKFTREFANAIDVIVRSVKTGLPVIEAMKVVSTEIPEPVASEFKQLIEGLKVGVTMEQGLKRMFERMPTAEVNFFGIVITVQQKSGGNLSEALSNLALVLRDRKRLHGKIRAMSSEAKASAMIIGSLPPAVMALVYFTTPQYIDLLFQVKLGNLMLLGCVVWMGLGILVMKKMISFKF